MIAERKRQTVASAIGAVVFGSVQGLVGQFNDVAADYAVETLAALTAKSEIWAVGERVHACLAAMQRAGKNINELLEELNRTFHRLRQSGIGEELFDVISGFEALTAEEK